MTTYYSLSIGSVSAYTSMVILFSITLLPLYEFVVIAQVYCINFSLPLNIFEVTIGLINCGGIVRSRSGMTIPLLRFSFLIISQYQPSSFSRFNLVWVIGVTTMWIDLSPYGHNKDLIKLLSTIVCTIIGLSQALPPLLAMKTIPVHII